MHQPRVEHRHMTSPTAEDRLLIKTLQFEKVWPYNSPDPNPMDYLICDALHQLVDQGHSPSLKFVQFSLDHPVVQTESSSHGVLQYCMLVSGITISQGSVANHLRCGAVFNAHFFTNLLLSVPVKYNRESF